MSDNPTRDWLLSMGFTYHAIGKYYYQATFTDTLLVFQKDDGRSVLGAVADHIDPSRFLDDHATLSDPATKEDVLTLLTMMNRPSQDG